MHSSVFGTFHNMYLMHSLEILMHSSVDGTISQICFNAYALENLEIQFYSMKTGIDTAFYRILSIRSDAFENINIQVLCN